MKNNFSYATAMAVLIIIMVCLRLFEHAIITMLFCIFGQLIIINGKMK